MSKRLLLVFMLVISMMTTNAQINRTIMGLTLGENTFTEVKSIMSKKGLTFDKKLQEGRYMAVANKAFDYAGQSWNIVTVDIFQGKLMSVYLSYGLHPDSDGIKYKSIKGKLDEKYYPYIVPSGDMGTHDAQTYCDGLTITRIYTLDSEAGLHVYLMYSDFELAQKKRNSEKDDL